MASDVVSIVVVDFRSLTSQKTVIYHGQLLIMKPVKLRIHSETVLL